ncbi:MAG: hypothetical protein ACK4Y4_01000 [Brevundimonas sp.]
MQAPRGSVWMVAGVFAIVGCYVGGVIVVAFALFGSRRPVGLDDLLLLPLVALAGYPFGIVPALLTGAVSGAISGWMRSKILWVMTATITGFAISILTFPEPSENWRFIGPIGAVAAFVSALVALNVRPRWSN